MTSETLAKPPYLTSAARWWARLNGKPDKREANPGALARLRRETSALAAWGEPDTARLYGELGFKRDDYERVARMEAVGALAILLAGVGENGPGVSLGTALGAGGDGAVPLMNSLRVRRLVAARDVNETLRGFREAIALLRGSAPVVDLARCVLGWLDPATSDRARSRFLFDYHGGSIAAPKSSDESDLNSNTDEPSP